MGRGRDRLEDGRRAWHRLGAWYRDGTPGPDALDALSDVGTVRHLLDRAEFAAVWAARRHGSSWSEIAAAVGITRQSAWERWRDVDDADEKGASRQRAVAAAAEELTATARKRRREGTVRVPNVIGMSLDEARRVLRDAQLLVAGPDADGPPLVALGWPSGDVVTGQAPEWGARVPPGSTVTVWLSGDDGGSAGVREPLRPRPDPKSARALRYEPDESPR